MKRLLWLIATCIACNGETPDPPPQAEFIIELQDADPAFLAVAPAGADLIAVGGPFVGEGPPAILAAVALNAGAGLWLAGAAEDIVAGYERVQRAFSDGTVGAKLDEIVKRSNELSNA